MKFITPLLIAAMAASLPATAEIRNANTIKLNPGDTREQVIEKAVHVVPTANQLDALQRGYIAFIHFGPNTFSRREWGTGFEDPADFRLENLDTDQWCAAMKAAGMKMVILTVKHHDGFVIWQSRYTRHGIMSSPFRDGKGDVLRDLSASCRKYGLKLGIYLSPADLYQIENPDGLYGNLSPKTTRTIPRPVEGRPFANKTTFTFDGIDDYNEYFLNQLFELLTEYGEIDEVWFDGAHPKRKGGQTYNYKAWKELIHKLAPKAVIFGREDIRWCGNEGGGTRPTEWNVIGYQENPDTAQHFADMTAADLGSIDELMKARFLHYQPAETNTSIREGWFYRDDERQKSRTPDDIFDTYERAVGGNSIFLLNIPPNREGCFSQVDVDAITEAGSRIADTYTTSLIPAGGADRKLLDSDIHTSVKADKPITVDFGKSVTINRFMLQEPVADHSERIESLALDAWLGGEWKEIASCTNVGFKRILRFPDVTTERLRVRVTATRALPYLAELGAYFYKAHAPQLASSRSLDGMVSIAPTSGGFGWNRNGQNPGANLSAGAEIRYTTDGAEPTAESALYTEPFRAERATVKARAFLHGEQGSVAETTYGYIKQPWKIASAGTDSEKAPASAAIDANASTVWAAPAGADAWIAIDLGQPLEIAELTYTPQTRVHGKGMMDRGRISVSDDGATWREADTFEFGNLINDPTPRTHVLKAPVKARYVRIDALSTAGGDDTVAIAEIDIR